VTPLAGDATNAAVQRAERIEVPPNNAGFGLFGGRGSHSG